MRLRAAESAAFCLLRRLSQRPTADELKQRNILQGEAEQAPYHQRGLIRLHRHLGATKESRYRGAN